MSTNKSSKHPGIDYIYNRENGEPEAIVDLTETSKSTADSDEHERAMKELDDFVDSLHPEQLANIPENYATINKLNRLRAREIATRTPDEIRNLFSFYVLTGTTAGDPDRRPFYKVILDELPPELKDELTEQANKTKAAYINAGKLQQRGEAVEKYLVKELQKDKYNGETIDTLLYSRDPEELADQDNPRTQLIYEAIKAAEQAAKKAKKRGPYITDTSRGPAPTDEIPDHLAIISRKEYTNALNFNSLFKAPEGAQFDEAGHIMAAGRIETKFDSNGDLYIISGSDTAADVSKIKLTTAKNHEVIESINRPNLDLFFTIILSNVQKQIRDGEDNLTSIVSIDAYDLAEKLGKSRNLGKIAINNAINAAQEFQNIVGTLKNSNSKRPSEYAVLQFKKYDEHANTITIESPYIKYLIETLYAAAIRRNSAGRIETAANGEPLIEPIVEYLIHADIIKERDKAAIENVNIITVLVEQAGNFTPNISAREILNRNELLKYRIEKEPNTSRKNQVLKRVFSNTWKYLKNDTDIQVVYEGIKIPDITPTIQNLDIVFYFSNKGKKHTARK